MSRTPSEKLSEAASRSTLPRWPTLRHRWGHSFLGSSASGDSSCARPYPGAGEDRGPVRARVVADWAQAECRAAVCGRVRPGPLRIGVGAEPALVVLRVGRIVDGGAHLQVDVWPVADVE